MPISHAQFGHHTSQIMYGLIDDLLGPNFDRKRVLR